MGIPLSSVANSRPTRPLIPFFNNRIFQKGCAKMLKGYISLILLAAIAISLTSSSIVKRQTNCVSACRQCKTDFGSSSGLLGGLIKFNCDQGCGMCPLCNLPLGGNVSNCKHCKQGSNMRQKINNCKNRCKEGKRICDNCGC